jgi:hypothetical protein
MPTVRIAAAIRRDKRCPRDHFGPTVLDFLTWPAMWRSGLRIVGTNLIVALQLTAPLGPRVNAGYAGYEAARSPARRMSYAQRRASDTITMCATTLTDSASREILDSWLMFFVTRPIIVRSSQEKPCRPTKIRLSASVFIAAYIEPISRWSNYRADLILTSLRVGVWVPNVSCCAGLCDAGCRPAAVCRRPRRSCIRQSCPPGRSLWMMAVIGAMGKRARRRSL